MSAKAEERVGIGSLKPRPLAELGSSVTVLDRQDIEQRGVPFVSELLREVPGVSVNRTSGFGSFTQVRIRGAEGNHTLVLIDGVEMNDFAANDEYDFGNLLSDDVERIEVLRGPQSALYGSQAIGGVINIVTREAPPGVTGSVSGEVGSFGMRRAHALLGGGSERLRLTGSVTFLDTHGISSSPDGGERDGNRNHTYNLKGTFLATDQLRFGGNLRYSREDLERDNQEFNFPVLPTDGLVVNTRDASDSEQWSGLAFAELDLFEGRWNHRIELSKLDTRRDERDDGLLTAENRGDKRRYRYQTSFDFDALGVTHTATGAFEHEENRFNSRPFDISLSGSGQNQKIDQNSWIGEYRLAWRDRVFLSASLRDDENDLFDDATTYRLTGSWLLPWQSTRIHASYGEGVQNPGVFELFGFFPGFFIGNPDLQPEESQGWEFGFEQELLDGRASVGMTYFDSKFDEEIDGFVFDPMAFAFTAENLDGTSDREGLETVLRYEALPNFVVSATYSYLDAEDPDGVDEVRRPKHSGSLNANLRLLRNRANLNLSVIYNGEMDDNEFVAGTPETIVELDAYTLVQLRGSYQLTDRLEIFGRIENLLDDDYHEIEGFETPGFGAFAGLNFRWGR